MFPTMPHQLYTPSEQRPRDLPSAEIAAGLRDLRLRVRRVLPSGR